MKMITKYVADDGREFSHEEDCRQHEVLLAKIKDADALLSARPEGCKFKNGHGYVQQTREACMSYRERLLDLAEPALRVHFAELLANLRAHDGVATGFLGRILGDSASPLSRMCFRLACIDERTWREWGQPYYAREPHDAPFHEAVMA